MKHHNVYWFDWHRTSRWSDVCRGGPQNASGAISKTASASDFDPEAFWSWSQWSAKWQDISWEKSAGIYGALKNQWLLPDALLQDIQCGQCPGGSAVGCQTVGSSSAECLAAPPGTSSFRVMSRTFRGSSEVSESSLSRPKGARAKLFVRTNFGGRSFQVGSERIW